MEPPKHYKSTMLMDYLISHGIGFAEGNICKYVVRWQSKGGIQDLYKARDYLNALIASVALLSDNQQRDDVQTNKGLLPESEKL